MNKPSPQAPTFNPCILIPSFDHSETLSVVIEGTLFTGLPYLIIDDGSSLDHRERLLKVGSQYPQVTIHHHTKNLGKGAAVKTGLGLLHKKGFSHGIQVDSDGQHDFKALKILLQISEKRPQIFVSGQPVYGDDIPAIRKWGRYLTHICVWIQTLSFQIRDSMCGYRSYPLDACSAILETYNLGDRMDFDTEILVYSYWMGGQFSFFPVPVHYPEGGRSHFRMFRDNILMTKMHTKLILGMIPRLPKLIFLHRPRSKIHWSEIKETGSLKGLHFLLSIYSFFGGRFLKAMLYPVALYYSFFHSGFRKASLTYLGRWQRYSQKLGSYPKTLSSVQHIHQFASMIVDKVGAWKQDIPLEKLYFPPESEIPNMLKSQKGAILITSHLGNIEVCRALAHAQEHIKISVLHYEKNSERFNRFYNRLGEGTGMNLISVDRIGVGTGIMLQEKLEQKHWICITGDRLPPGQPGRTFRHPFLGEMAEFPQGPFLLASKFDAPVYAVHCVPEGEKFALFATKISSNRPQGRSAYPKQLFEAYIAELEKLTLKYPLQWFNMYDFWKPNE